MAILTAAQSKAARLALGLSQNKVAKETGINRSTLALFEVNKYLLEDRFQRQLRDFYESQGHSLEMAMPTTAAPRQPETPPAGGETDTRIIDGFAIPAGLDQDKVEAAFDEIYANDQAIAEISAQPIKRDWFGYEIETEASDKALALMARNYVLIRQVQGHESLSPANDEAEDEPETYGDVVRRRIKG